MTHKRRNGRTRASATVSNNLVTSEQHQHSRAPRVVGRFYGPAARRSLGVLVVTACPFCPSGGPHVHRGSGGLRRAGCGGGEYVVVPAQGLPQPRKRGAA